MASVTIPYSFTNGYAADANEVNQNFLALKAFVDASLVQVDGSVQATSAAITDGTIVNVDISATAAIAYAKLNLATSIVNADISTTAAIALSKLATTGTVTATTFVGALTGTASGNLVSGGALGTPSSGTLTNCTFPTVPNATNATNATTATTATNLTGLFKGSNTVTLTGQAGFFYHNMAVTPSTVVLTNGDLTSAAGHFAVVNNTATAVNFEGVGTAPNATVRVNWIAFV